MVTSAVVTSLSCAVVTSASAAQTMRLAESNVEDEVQVVHPVKPFMAMGSEFGSDFQGADLGKIDGMVAL